VARVQEAVLSGMGLLVLHSAHYSKIFKALLGTPCDLRWRNEGERELVWTVNPSHPIAQGVPHPIVIDAQEMYGEHFDIPEPDELVFVSSFAGGEVFRLNSRNAARTLRRSASGKAATSSLMRRPVPMKKKITIDWEKRERRTVGIA